MHLAYDRDGRLRIASAPISRAGIVRYLGDELMRWRELDLEPDRFYRILRSPAEFARTAASFNAVPLLRRHAHIAADSFRPDDVIGTLGTSARFEHPYLVNDVIVWTKDAIADIESGRRRELSIGFNSRPDMTPGKYEGEPYDGVMKSITGNHVALTECGRAGSDVAIVGDNRWKEAA